MKSIILVAACLIAGTAKSQEFSGPSTSLQDVRSSLPAGSVPSAEPGPVVEFVRGSPTPQPSYIHMCRAGMRRSTWHWSQSDARAEACGGESCCRRLECWQARWTGFTPDCDRGQCTRVPVNSCSRAAAIEPEINGDLPIVLVKGGAVSTQQSIYKCAGGWSWSGGPGCKQWIWSSPSCRGASPCPLRSGR